MWTMKEYSGKENQRIKFPLNPSPRAAARPSVPQQQAPPFQRKAER